MVEAKAYATDGVLVFVLGTTGVGKSKLAMDLATNPTLFSGKGVSMKYERSQ